MDYGNGLAAYAGPFPGEQDIPLWDNSPMLPHPQTLDSTRPLSCRHSRINAPIISEKRSGGIRLFRAAIIVCLVVLAASCADQDATEPRPGSGPEPVQLPPPEGTSSLSAQQVDTVVRTATADPTVEQALRQGVVGRIQVRASAAGEPAGTVVFLFQSPVQQPTDPWPVMCDIAGQTREWQGVAAKVTLGASRAVESSPVWLTGNNCVGAQI